MATSKTPPESEPELAPDAKTIARQKRRDAQKQATEALLGAAGIVSLAMLIREITK